MSNDSNNNNTNINEYNISNVDNNITSIDNSYNITTPNNLDNDNDNNYHDKDSSTLEVYSHVQTRGSIPLHWSSPVFNVMTYRPRVYIGVDPHRHEVYVIIYGVNYVATVQHQYHRLLMRLRRSQYHHSLEEMEIKSHLRLRTVVRLLICPRRRRIGTRLQ